MNRILKSFFILLNGASIQIVSYIGIFLSIYLASNMLDSRSFAQYVQVTTIAPLIGTFICLGTDKLFFNIGLNLIDGDQTKKLIISGLSLCLCIILLCFLLLCLILCLVGIIAWLDFWSNVLFVFTGLRLAFGGLVRASNSHALGSISIFSIGQLVLSFIVLISTYAHVPVIHDATAWIFLSSLIELTIVCAMFYSVMKRYKLTLITDIQQNAALISRYFPEMISIVSWSAFAQSGLMSVFIGGIIYSPNIIGQYALAFRISQIALLPWISGIQVALPYLVRSRFDDEHENIGICKFIVLMIFSIVMLFSSLIAVYGDILLPLAFPIYNSDTHQMVVLLLLSSIIFAASGFGDQGLVATGNIKLANRITVFSTAVCWAGWTAGYLLGLRVHEFIFVLLISIALRQISSWLALRRLGYHFSAPADLLVNVLRK